MNRAREQFSNLTSRFGFGKVLGCGCLGCLAPIVMMMVFTVTVGWWLFGGSGGGTQQVYSTPRYTAPVAYQAPTVSQPAPTPVYAPDNAQGAVRNPELPSMMGNQPLHADYRTEGAADYMPYTGDHSKLSTNWYLAQANFTGARRTPYVKGQQLSNGLTVVTGDFDFVLLQDVTGTQWFCDPTGINCTFWR